MGAERQGENLVKNIAIKVKKNNTSRIYLFLFVTLNHIFNIINFLTKNVYRRKTKDKDIFIYKTFEEKCGQCSEKQMIHLQPDQVKYKSYSKLKTHTSMYTI